MENKDIIPTAISDWQASEATRLAQEPEAKALAVCPMCKQPIWVNREHVCNHATDKL